MPVAAFPPGWAALAARRRNVIYKLALTLQVFAAEQASGLPEPPIQSPQSRALSDARAPIRDDRAAPARAGGSAVTVVPPPPPLELLKAKAPEVARFLRRLASPNRLLLLCHIAQGERSVTEIQADLGLKQPALSQQLAELREAGLVQARRESRSVYYSIKDSRAQAVMATLHAVFCQGGAATAPPPSPAPAAAPATPAGEDKGPAASEPAREHEPEQREDSER